VFDTSSEQEPLQFTIGKKEVIPGFEQAILGMNVGDSKTTKISASRAYGPHRDDLIVEVDRKNIDDDMDIEVGQRLKIKQPDGQEFIVKVAEIQDSTVKLDANHPLAGKDLTFDIDLVDVVTN
jgi:FKBP-type peptidyl-prolyl cis-trans isomerase 2